MCCMEEHEVKTALVSEQSVFKGKSISYGAIYSYCDVAEELYMDEQQMQINDIEIKNAYRKAEGLLTSDEISNIRAKYRISQKDFCILLGWGEKTITRYEGHQVQDKAHDTILKKIDRDPEWFLTLLKDVKDCFAEETYRKYYETATSLYETSRDVYLRKAIEANYVNYQGKKLYNGNAKLSLDKVVDVIRYFASSCKVTSLYKVKLMKLMWYADMLSYKKRGFGITGLVYQVLPMGAVPVGHNSIIDLNYFANKNNMQISTNTISGKKSLDLLLVDEIKDWLEVDVKTRYSTKSAKAKIIQEDNKIRVVFEEPQRAITPGQSAVFYIEDYVAAGGKIL